MSAVAGTRRGMKELVDGTIRVQIDIDPQYRAKFFQLFGEIDMKVGIAPLVPESAVPAEKHEAEKGGALAKLAGRWCQMPEFWAWINSNYPDMDPIASEQDAARYIRVECGVGSRASLDSIEVAAQKFHEYIREPYSEWLKGR